MLTSSAVQGILYSSIGVELEKNSTERLLWTGEDKIQISRNEKTLKNSEKPFNRKHPRLH
jgi:hypothetical protein